MFDVIINNNRALYFDLKTKNGILLKQTKVVLKRIHFHALHHGSLQLFAML